MRSEIVIHHGFHPEQKRVYKGEEIYKVVAERGLTKFNDYLTGVSTDDEARYYKLENDGWIKDAGEEKYTTDWNAEERWGRVERRTYDDDNALVETEDLGFMILRVDREHGLL